MCFSGYDPLTFLSCPFSFLIGIVWPQLSKVLKLVRWAPRVLFPPVSLKKVYINVILCFSLSESYNAQEKRTYLKRSINSSTDSENKMSYALRVRSVQVNIFS